ncbi:CBS domain-containing protein [Brucepastera parasyntrophica]|uniref:transporter associated domain-containing protein n=1 Tax=Brucepastera parasyntrophica TaxID=2880008 RepID=UPI00210CB7A2|nr:transporter associated domain-containing protein [Brucepastera parasyntrophica]ULQ60344.1 CBS domain-containing protein [Brucepastera parasyntrophica]
MCAFHKKNKESGVETVEGIFLPAYRKIGSCMVHRPDIIWIDASKKKEEITPIITENREIAYFPVCSGTIDSVLGVLSARDFLASLLESEWPGLKKLVKKPVYLPETVSIVKTLGVIANTESSLVFIIDEYGGIEGLVTKNGLVTEILEDISDDTSEGDPDIFQREDGSWLVSGQVRMDELPEAITLPAAPNSGNEYYTLAGYLLSVRGSIPKTGDRITAGDYICEIVDMDGHRIDKVLISKTSDS